MHLVPGTSIGLLTLTVIGPAAFAVTVARLLRVAPVAIVTVEGEIDALGA